MHLRSSLALLLTALPSLALATSRPLENQTLDEQVRSAELIFRGTVVSIDTRLSETDAVTPNPVPHTFVTYRIDQVLKGASEDPTITLRFIGGPVNGDRFMFIMGMPLFDRGDTDVLLVKDNLRGSCPLVGCSRGRFREIDGMIVNEEGQRIQRAPSGELFPGPAMELEDIETTTMSKSIKLRRIGVTDPDAPPQYFEPYQAPPLDPALDFKPEQFLSFMRTAIDANHTPEDLEAARKNPVPSGDASLPFYTWSIPPEDSEPEPAPDPTLVARADVPQAAPPSASGASGSASALPVEADAPTAAAPASKLSAALPDSLPSLPAVLAVVLTALMVGMLALRVRLRKRA
jgi:hypothetical protein